MADEITACTKVLDDNDAVVQYDVVYKVEDPNDANRVNRFCVTILASEMTDPASATEAKTKANVKAAEIKTDWLAQAGTSAEAVASVVGNVTL